MKQLLVLTAGLVVLSGIALVGACQTVVPDTGTGLAPTAYLADPFLFADGSRMTRLDQWPARRAEISALAQQYEYGTKPALPTAISGEKGVGDFTNSWTGTSRTADQITVTVTEGGNTISFRCEIEYPATGTGPFPAIIGIGSSTLNNADIKNLGVAIINFPCDDLAAQQSSGSRGTGKFYDLYGSSHSAGALMAWAWGVDCLISALETTPAANIDASRLGVTGGSRYGKGALAAGAFCERIKLVIPQESGSGGAASWRVSEAQQAAGQNVQTLGEIIRENCWFSPALEDFSGETQTLPFDHHSIFALCAPRALLVIENTSMEWLGNESTWTTANVAHFVWEALGVGDKMGFSQVGNHDHCVLPDSQLPELRAYINRYLIGQGTGDTRIMKTDGGFAFDQARWMDWTMPVLQ